MPKINALPVSASFNNGDVLPIDSFSDGVTRSITKQVLEAALAIAYSQLTGVPTISLAKEVTINVPFAQLETTITVVDVDITATSKLFVSWGVTTDLDYNSPQMDPDICFSITPGVGECYITISRAGADFFVGDFKLNYIIVP
jgi:hypothetical protein